MSSPRPVHGQEDAEANGDLESAYDRSDGVPMFETDGILAGGERAVAGYCLF